MKGLLLNLAIAAGWSFVRSATLASRSSSRCFVTTNFALAGFIFEPASGTKLQVTSSPGESAETTAAGIADSVTRRSGSNRSSARSSPPRRNSTLPAPSKSVVTSIRHWVRSSGRTSPRGHRRSSGGFS